MIDGYKIIEAAKDSRYPGDVCYFVVQFLEGGNVVCTEDFQMPHLKESANVPVLDVAGDFVLNDGKKLRKKDLDDSFMWIQDEYVKRIDDAEKTVLLGLKDDYDPVDGHIIIHPTRISVYEQIERDIHASPQAAAASKWKQVKRQTIALDVGRQVQENIERHIKTLNAKGLTGDRRDKTMKPSDKQPIGISQRADVLLLRAKVKAVKNLAPIAEVRL